MDYQIIRPSDSNDLIGGRVKSASIGLGKILSLNDICEIDKFLIDIAKGKDKLSNLSRFPDSNLSMYNALRKSPLRAFGKTDQGMPGNFYPFLISSDSEINLTFEFENETFEAIIEPKYEDIISLTNQNDIIDLLRNNNLFEAYNILINLPKIDDVWGKGKNPFFICRPAQTNKIITIPENIIDILEQKVKLLFKEGSYMATNIAQKYKEDNLNINSDQGYSNQVVLSNDIELYENSVVYFQVDALIDKEGTVSIEKINLPDIGGWFLDTFSDIGSLKITKEINKNVRRSVIEKIKKLGFSKLFFVTRSDVIYKKEDLLEIRELEIIQNELLDIGIEINIISPDQIQNNEGPFFLMNIDYNKEEGFVVLSQAINKPNMFFPNPFMQIAMNRLSGFKYHNISKQNNEKQFNEFMGLFSAKPKNKKKRAEKIEQDFFKKLGFNTHKYKLYYIKNHFNYSSFIPVLSNSLYSLRKIESFLNKENIDNFDILEVPFENGKQRLQKEGHDVLHFYRFMGISK